MQTSPDDFAETAYGLRSLVDYLRKNVSSTKTEAFTGTDPIGVATSFSNKYKQLIDMYETSHAGADMSKYKNVVLTDLLAFGGGCKLELQENACEELTPGKELGLHIPQRVQRREAELLVSYVQRELQKVVNDAYLLIYQQRRDDLQTLRTLGACIGAGCVWIQQPSALHFSAENECSSDYDFE